MFLGKKNTPSTSATKPCRYCNKAWSPNHTCKEYYSSDRYKEREELKHKILSVTTAADDDEDTDKINNMLNKLGPE